MPGETALEGHAGFKVPQSARVHVAAEEEHARHARGCLPSEDQSSACAVAPTGHCGFFETQHIHDLENVRRHQLIPERPGVARAAAVTTAIDKHDAIAGLHEPGHLITPIAAMAKTDVEQDNGPAGT